MNKYLSLLLPFSVLTFSISPAWGQENATPEITFRCESDRDIPLTIAENNTGQTENIFIWQENILKGKTANSPKELCHDVTSKLNKYVKGERTDSSSFNLSANNFYGIPVICAGSYRSCSQVLFTLNADEENITIGSQVLDNIVAPNIKQNLFEYVNSGIRGYKVDLFSDKS